MLANHRSATREIVADTIFPRKRNASRILTQPRLGMRMYRPLRLHSRTGKESKNPPLSGVLKQTGLNRIFVWWAHLDLNQEPSGYEPAALTT